MLCYTLGFAFYEDHVLLVEKARGPAVNLGKFNGIGGKLEPKETYKDCMVREFKEETTLVTSPDDWELIGEMGNATNKTMYDYSTIFHMEIFKLRNLEDIITHPELVAVPHINDVGEKLLNRYALDILRGVDSSRYGQNVQSIIAHCLTGQGLIKLSV